MAKTKKPASKTKKSTPKPKKQKKPEKPDADMVLSPLGDGSVCNCGCGLLADTVDFDTGAPASFRCCINKAKVARDSQA